ncbi:hypothetical protein [Pseudomonas sp. TTU2014-080ASC]|uniref:hypothetical protein n=1 Tax=Pseudomonas sp. TTU2014-080ASC TaxID=1729724 RepID=UPI0007185C67|nr:hypothetical protein [Pseudomonas sp. TTU2014-080ASC]KRW58870.1 hypothetical protein AO726_15260 [Pseudomonas sp. TTU2014-080ASC]
MDISRSAFSSAISTVQSGQRRVDQAAAEIASQTLPQSPSVNPTPPTNPVESSSRASEANRPDLAESLVGLQEGLQQVQAGSKVAKSADEVLGTLIDTRA